MKGSLVKTELAPVYFSKLRRLVREIQKETDLEEARQQAVYFFIDANEVRPEVRQNVIRVIKETKTHMGLLRYLFNLILRGEAMYERHLEETYGE